MGLTNILYSAGLGVLVLGAVWATSSGAMLPGPDSSESISLRNVQARRTHFMRYYAFGK